MLKTPPGLPLTPAVFQGKAARRRWGLIAASCAGFALLAVPSEGRATTDTRAAAATQAQKEASVQESEVEPEEVDPKRMEPGTNKATAAKLNASFQALDSEAERAPARYPGGMNEAEWNFCRWPSRYRICNKASNHAKVAGRAAEQRFSARELHNGRGDAYRHCYWNARMAIDMGIRTAKGFGDRHEQTPGQPAIEKEMDLRNNTLGRAISTGRNYTQASTECERRARGNGLWRIVKGQLV
jgi:hypothetical protein